MPHHLRRLCQCLYWLTFHAPLAGTLFSMSWAVPPEWVSVPHLLFLYFIHLLTSLEPPLARIFFPCPELSCPAPSSTHVFRAGLLSFHVPTSCIALCFPHPQCHPTWGIVFPHFPLSKWVGLFFFFCHVLTLLLTPATTRCTASTPTPEETQHRIDSDEDKAALLPRPHGTSDMLLPRVATQCWSLDAAQFSTSHSARFHHIKVASSHPRPWDASSTSPSSLPLFPLPAHSVLMKCSTKQIGMSSS